MTQSRQDLSVSPKCVVKCCNLLNVGIETEDSGPCTSFLSDFRSSPLDSSIVDRIRRRSKTELIGIPSRSQLTVSGPLILYAWMRLGRCFLHYQRALCVQSRRPKETTAILCYYTSAHRSRSPKGILEELDAKQRCFMWTTGGTRRIAPMDIQRSNSVHIIFYTNNKERVTN